MTEKFYIVWNPQGRNPSYRHPTKESAVEEAMRLARNVPGQTFIVLESVGESVAGPAQWTDHGDEGAPPKNRNRLRVAGEEVVVGDLIRITRPEMSGLPPSFKGREFHVTHRYEGGTIFFEDDHDRTWSAAPKSYELIDDLPF